MKKYAAFFAVLPFLVLAGCKSGPREIEQGLTPPEYFQRAQQAVIEWNDYDTALAYYKIVLEQFPNDRQNGIIAEYEIAFIHYKLGEYETAKPEFVQIVAAYEEDLPVPLPAWPQVLAEKLIAKIEESEE